MTPPNDTPLVPADAPLISVIIPAFNRPTALSSCLAALARQEPPAGGYEVIVVDDGSSPPLALAPDTTREVPGLRYLRQLNQGPAAARNHGAETARGRLLVFTDDDCQPQPDWLNHLASGHARSPDAVFTGRTINALSDNPYSETSECIIESLYAVCNHNPEQAHFFTSNNLAIPTGIFRSVGGFDQTYRLAAGEDRELARHLNSQNIPMIYLPEAVVMHHHALSARGFLRQHFNYGRAAWHYHWQWRQSTGANLQRQGNYGHLLHHPLKSRRGLYGCLLSGLVAVAQAVVAAGMCREAIGWRGRAARHTV